MRTLLIITSLLLGPAISTFAAEPPVAPDGSFTLMGVLQEWIYPGAKFGGAEVSDDDNPLVQSARCKALLTTDDSVEQVVRYYIERLRPSREKAADNAAPANDDVANQNPPEQVVLVQDASAGRPLQLQVITVARPYSSTTLVISRAEGEKQTQIAWSHHRRTGDNP